jgi:hypothetical protein
MPEANNGVTVVGERAASVVDSKGRTIKVKRLSSLDRMRLYTVAGAENAENSRYMGYAFLAASVTAIDDMDYAPPTGILQIEALVDKLDEPGMDAIARAVLALTSNEGSVARAARNLSSAPASEQ